MNRAVVYARISVTSEESVSVERQVEAARQYAAARGWEVVGTYTDDGVSATHNKPDARAGWRALVESSLAYDRVIIWKLDRLARRVLDFHLANQALEDRGAALVAIENSIDMSSHDGRLVANVLASFAEYEAAAISARVKAARAHLLRAGRVVGGTMPYGWKSAPNPNGPGFVVVQDPETVQWVQGAATRVLAGHSLYSVVQWLDASGAPLPKASQSNRKAGNAGHAYTTWNRLLRNPILAGMTAWNPDNTSKRRGDDVLRGTDGLPVVDESIAILEVGEWRTLVKALDERPTPQAKPRAMRSKTSGVLSGLLYCGDPRHGDAPVRMWRGTVQGRPGFQCPKCYQTISSFEDAVVAEFLRVKGSWVRWTPVEEVFEGGAALLPEIEHRLDELEALIRNASRDERPALMAQQATLLDERDARRSEAPVVSLRFAEAGLFASEWAAAADDVERRAVLGDALERIVVRRGKPGRRTTAQMLERLDFTWKAPQQVGAPEDRSLTG